MENKSRESRVRGLLLRLTLLAATLTAACGVSSTSSTLGVSGDEYVTRNTITELVRASNVVVLGVVEGAAGTRNMARNPQNPLEEDRNYVVLGQDYRVRVSTILKGNAPDLLTVTVAKAHGVAGKAPVGDHGFIPLTSGGHYVLFLRKQVDGTAGFVPAPEPFRFRISDLARPESPWGQAQQQFAARDLATLLSEIKSAVSAN